jgi:hypothetical protein
VISNEDVVNVCMTNQHAIEQGTVNFIYNQFDVAVLIDLSYFHSGLDQLPNSPSASCDERLKNGPIAIIELSLCKKATHYLAVLGPELLRHP